MITRCYAVESGYSALDTLAQERDDRDAEDGPQLDCFSAVVLPPGSRERCCESVTGSTVHYKLVLARFLQHRDERMQAWRKKSGPSVLYGLFS